MRTPILFIVITGERERKTQRDSIAATNDLLLSVYPSGKQTFTQTASTINMYITALSLTANRHGHKFSTLTTTTITITTITTPSLPHLPLHRDCHCYWYATQPSHLISQAAATPMRAYAGRNPNHPRLRHTDPFDPTERRVSGLSLCP